MKQLSLSLHPARFAEKPTGQQAGQVSLTIARHGQTISLDEFVEALQQGRTWSALFGLCPRTNQPSRSKATWLKQQVFAADIDSGDLSKREVLAKAHEADVEPCILHKTFSYTESARKWRVITAVNKCVTSPELALSYQRYLANAFGGDSAVADVSRLYYGCKAGGVVYCRAVYDEPKQLAQVQKPSGTASIGKALADLTKAEKALLRGTIAYCAQALARPESSRYMAIWHCGRRLGQLSVLDSATIAELVVKLALQTPSLYCNYDKPIDRIAKAGAEWGSEHNG